MKFFLGTHIPSWLGRLDFPLFISNNGLRKRRSYGRALGPWALDSGAFTEIQTHGRWTIGAEEYVDSIRTYQEKIGNLLWAAQQDYMCEPFMLEKTGLTVEHHQQLTIENFLELRALAPDLPIIPVLQGWTIDDYQSHIDSFIAAGVDLPSLSLVGVGSVCRRQATTEIENIVRSISERDISIHGFGVKTKGLLRYGGYLTSADSLAWSYQARREPPLPHCVGHKNCANCIDYAVRWRDSLRGKIEAEAERGALYRAA